MRKKLMAAILNIGVWGLGYIYDGKRKLYGLGWLGIYIIAHFPLYYIDWRYYFTEPPGILMTIFYAGISLLLAYDVYDKRR